MSARQTARIMESQQFPDSQKEPLGLNQQAWIDEKYGKAFFRDAQPLVQACVCKLPEQSRTQ
jgi:hypothetical protein